MPVAYLDQAQCADQYTDALTMGPDFSARKAIIVVEANDVFMQFAQGDPGNWHWTDERDWRSIAQSLSVSNIIGIRFRNATAGQVAIVTCSLLGDSDPDFESGFPSSVKVTNSMITGIIPAAGQLATAGTGFTYTHTDLSGIYVFSFKTAFAATPTIICQLGPAAAAAGREINVTATSPTGFTVSIDNGLSPPGGEDHAFMFIATPTV